MWHLYQGGDVEASDLASLKLRGMHDKRDQFNKIGLPALLAFIVLGGAAGAAFATIPGIAGESLLDIQRGTDNLMNALNGGTTYALGSAAIGFAGSLVVQACVRIKERKLRNSIKEPSYYVSKMKDNTFNFEKSKLAEVLADVSTTNEEILNLKNNGKSYRKLNLHNRVNIKALQWFLTESVQLYADYCTDSSINVEIRRENLKNLGTLIQKVNTAIHDDIVDSIVFFFTNCNENGEHTHNDYIEDLDIYANIYNYFKTIDKLVPDTDKEKKTHSAQLKEYKKKISHDATEKTKTATMLLDQPNGILDIIEARLLDVIKKHGTGIDADFVKETLGTTEIKLLDTSPEYKEGVKQTQNTVTYDKTKQSSTIVVAETYRGRNIKIQTNSAGTKHRYIYTIDGGIFKSDLFKISEVSVDELVAMAKDDIDHDLVKTSTDGQTV